MIKNFISSLTLFLLIKEDLNGASAILIGLALFVLLFFGREHSHELLSYEKISRKSNFAKYDGGIKVLFTFICVFLIIFSKSITISLLAIAFVLYILMVKDKIKLKNILSTISLPLFFISISILTILYEVSLEGGFHFETGPAQLENARSLYLVIISAYLISLSLSLTSPITTIIYGLKKMKLSDDLIELMLVIRTYITRTYDIFKKKKISASLREGKGGYGAKRRSFYMIGSSLLKDSIYASRKNFTALESRGFDGSVSLVREGSEDFPYYYLIFLLVLTLIFIGEKIGII